MRFILTILTVGIAAALGSISVTDKLNVRTQVSYEELAAVPRDTIQTVREKDGTVKTDTWEGFRFDNWLRDKGWTDFNGIRFVSSDRYQVSMEKAEFDTLECWLVLSREGVPFEENSVRIIFPGLRDMYWVRDLGQVFLEDISPYRMPERFIPMDAFLGKYPITADPAPFQGIEGWRLEDIFAQYELPEDVEVLFVSGDMIKVKLLWGEHLQGAVLESYKGGYNLKSPRIPGGMWLKDVLYMQIGNRAWWREGSISILPELDQLLKWNLQPGAEAVLHSGKIHSYLQLNELMSASNILGGQEWFEIIQP